MKLRPGRFYVTEPGGRWCCFRVDEAAAPHLQAWCIEIATQRVERFYLDGRFVPPTRPISLREHFQGKSNSEKFQDLQLVGEVLEG
jgi:hypothetical protein